MECICCGLETVQSGRVSKVDDLVCETCTTNGSVLWEETRTGGCEICGKVEAYYGPEPLWCYVCRECTGTTVLEQVESLKKAEDEYYAQRRVA
jgi:hypothetical protein